MVGTRVLVLLFMSLWTGLLPTSCDGILRGKKPQVEIVTAFSSIAEEKFGRLDSYLHFQTIYLPIVGGCWCVFDVPGPCKFLKCCRNELRTIFAYKFTGTAMSCKILSLLFVLNLEVISGAFCF